MMKKVEDGFYAFFRAWNDVMIPKLIKSPKWFKTSRDLINDDVIYFQKVENELTSDWTMGLVEEVQKGKDGIIRRVTVKYQNSNEDFPRYTNRPVRKIVKLFDISDITWMDDMVEVEKAVKELTMSGNGDTSVGILIPDSGPVTAPSWATWSGATPATRPAGRATSQVNVMSEKYNSGVVFPSIIGAMYHSWLGYVPFPGSHVSQHEVPDQQGDLGLANKTQCSGKPSLFSPPVQPSGLVCECCCVPHHDIYHHTKTPTSPTLHSQDTQEFSHNSFSFISNKIQDAGNFLIGNSFDSRDTMESMIEAIDISFD